ncbi:MAG: glycosyltransferase family 4 protein [Gammaproteobacteria bacterium]|nr:glycosyltransferase family 4 protein [Gammaproteobacteria bacterium]
MSRLLFVVAKWFEFGGMQRSLLRIAEACAARGADVDVLCGRWEGDKPTGIRVIEHPLKAWSNEGKNRELAGHIARLKADGGYDAVVGFMKFPHLDVYYAGDPCFAERFARGKPAWLRFLPRYRHFLKLEEAVFGPASEAEILLFAHAEQAHYQRHYGTPDARFHVLPPGINRARLDDVAPEAPAALRAELGLAAEERVVLHVGSSFRIKGVDRLLAGYAALPEALRASHRLVIVGDDEPGPFRAQAKRWGIASRVLFTGARRDMASFYRIADALVHPAYSENTGTTLLESLILGVPVLASGICGFAHHVVDADTGLVCPEPFDQARFNAQFAELLSSPRRPDWQANGRRYGQTQDLYGLIDKAAELILARAGRSS